jgi:hypothetical protein
VDLRERLEQAAKAECNGANYELTPSDSIGNASTSSRLEFTLKGTVRCVSGIVRPTVSGVTGGSVTATGPVQIWSYTFTTIPADSKQPVTGEGSAIFKPDNDWLEGPMWSHDRLGYRLRFVISGKSATAILTDDKNPSAKVQLEGPVKETPESDGKGCSVVARLTNGLHSVVLQNYAEKCSS